MPGTPWGQQAHLYHAQADRRNLQAVGLQQGALDPYAFKAFSNGATRGVIMNPGQAIVQGSHAGVTEQGQYSVTSTASEVLVLPAGHATLPRVDQIILRVRDTEAQAGTAGDASSDWTIEILAGTPTAGATLQNRNGAPVLPASSWRIADVLVPAAFNATFVDGTHIRDRRTMARGAQFSVVYGGGDLTIPTAPAIVDIFGDNTANPNHGIRVECSGDWPLEVGFDSVISNASNAASTVYGGIKWDGSKIALSGNGLDFVLFYNLQSTGGYWSRTPHYVYHVPVWANQGSHTYSTWASLSGAGSASMTSRGDFPTRMWFRELVGTPDVQNIAGLTSKQMGPYSGA